jgi:hypothetical protein
MSYWSSLLGGMLLGLSAASLFAAIGSGDLRYARHQRG